MTSVLTTKYFNKSRRAQMLHNPDHAIIKALAVNLMSNMENTPDGLQTICPELLPIADFHNGLARPNNRPPCSVRLTLDGVLWIYGANKRWRRQ